MGKEREKASKEKRAIRMAKEKEAMLKTMGELAQRQPAMEEDTKSEGDSSQQSSVSDMSELLEETGGYLGTFLGAVGLVSNADPSLPEPSQQEIARNAAIMAELGLSTGKLEEGYLTADLTGSQKTTPRGEEPEEGGKDYWETGTTVASKPMKKSPSVGDVQEIAATSVKAHILGRSTTPPVKEKGLHVRQCKADTPFWQVERSSTLPQVKPEARKAAGDLRSVSPVATSLSPEGAAPSEETAIETRKRSNSREDRGKRVEAERALTKEREQVTICFVLFLCVRLVFITRASSPPGLASRFLQRGVRWGSQCGQHI